MNRALRLVAGAFLGAVVGVSVGVALEVVLGGAGLGVGAVLERFFGHIGLAIAAGAAVGVVVSAVQSRPAPPGAPFSPTRLAPWGRATAVLVGTAVFAGAVARPLVDGYNPWVIVMFACVGLAFGLVAGLVTGVLLTRAPAPPKPD